MAALELDAGHVRAVLAAKERPYVTLKAATTLDGKIASRHGESRWITGEAARAASRRLRGAHDAILVGVNTVLADDPQLTVREVGAGRDPARIVLDSRLRTPLAARCLASDGARRIVIAGSEAPRDRVQALRGAGVEVLLCADVRPQGTEFMPRLRQLGIATLLAEGGPQVHATLIAEQAADALFLFIAGMVMGDAAAPAWCATLPGENRLAGAPHVALAPAETVGGDLLVRGRFATP
jgi:diaminohydroxyphosphoribosylaminopyrimidine deaminase/5-amino-6-(5-phosphoribosylamino)uracil reductase